MRYEVEVGVGVVRRGVFVCLWWVAWGGGGSREVI